MKLSDFDYNLPKNLIATEPAKPRDHSRLLILQKETGEIEHKHFYDIVDYLKKGDCLVLNNSKVIPARLIGKKDTGGKVEVFLHKVVFCGSTAQNLAVEPQKTVWQCLLGAKKMKAGLKIYFDKGLEATVLRDNEDGTWDVGFNMSGVDFDKVLEKIGHVPLPPYIKKNEDKKNDKKSYQTIYADDNKKGSVAAPTAGLHFTPRLMKKLKDKGVQIEYITLHVGLGTFAPVKTEDIKKHKMHSELVEIDKETMARIYLAKLQDRRIITVGTTSTRMLEAIVSEFPISNFQPCLPAGRFPNNSQFSMHKFIKQFFKIKEFINIFIFPGYRFKIVDAMITNFHLPKSTLLMLVSALAGKKNIDKAYESAILNEYRFYSYGDAMLILDSN